MLFLYNAFIIIFIRILTCTELHSHSSDTLCLSSFSSLHKKLSLVEKNINLLLGQMDVLERFLVYPIDYECSLYDANECDMDVNVNGNTLVVRNNKLYLKIYSASGREYQVHVLNYKGNENIVELYKNIFNSIGECIQDCSKSVGEL